MSGSATVVCCSWRWAAAACGRGARWAARTAASCPCSAGDGAARARGQYLLTLSLRGRQRAMLDSWLESPRVSRPPGWGEMENFWENVMDFMPEIVA